MPEKYEREIEEILRRAAFSAPKRERRSSNWLSDLTAGWHRWSASLSPPQLLLFGLVLALAGYVLRAFLPELGPSISLVALALLVAGLILSITQRNARRPRGWRGRLFDAPAPNADVWESLKRRWTNWRRGRGWID